MPAQSVENIQFIYSAWVLGAQVQVRDVGALRWENYINYDDAMRFVRNGGGELRDLWLYTAAHEIDDTSDTTIRFFRIKPCL